MTETCSHDGWGRYDGETGPCPPPAELERSDKGVECPVCGYHLFTVTGPEALTRMFAHDRETATTARETR